MSLEKPAPAILWFRKDLRLDDNPALHAAIEAGGPVIPVYIREPAHLNIGPLGAAQAWWLHHSLAALKASLNSLGGDLILASGKAEDVLADLARKTNATTVFVNRAYERTLFDRGIAIELKKREIAIRAFHGQLLHEPKSIRTGAGSAFKVFTPFWNALQKVGEPHEPMAAPTKIPSPEHFRPSENLEQWALLPKKPDWAADFGRMWIPGEAGAQEKLADVVDRQLHDYKRGRDLPSVDATSLLSPHLAHGEVLPPASGMPSGACPQRLLRMLSISAANSPGGTSATICWPNSPNFTTGTGTTGSTASNGSTTPGSSAPGRRA
ncbi:Cryptochrome2c [Neorhizobium galegae bv. officinalis]|nr:Cryptochrome2c [Neorhizobium galegae bv. officinalis]